MRREYYMDENPLINSINEFKKDAGIDGWYISLAKKFDNSDYQWVIYTESLSIGEIHQALIALFDKAGTIVAQQRISNSYIVCGSQTCIVNGNFKHIFLLLKDYANSFRQGKLRTYCISCENNNNTLNSYYFNSYDVINNIGNFINDNERVIVNSNVIEWVSTSNRTYTTSVQVQITITDLNSNQPTCSSIVNRAETTGHKDVFLIKKDNNQYYWCASRWNNQEIADELTKYISWVATDKATGWAFSPNPIEPYVNRYYKCAFIPIWNWSETIEDIQKSLWWNTKTGQERKFLLKDYKTGEPTSYDDSQQQYFINNTDYRINSLGAITEDGIILYTCNYNTKMLEEVNTKILT